MAEAKWNHIILTCKVDIPQWTARWRNDLGDVLCKDSCYWLIDRGVPKGRVFIYFIVQTELHLRVKRGASSDYMGTVGLHQDHLSQTDPCGHPTKAET